MRKIQPAIRAFLEVTLAVPAGQRKELITRIFLPGRQRFLERTPGAVSKDLLVREEDIQILHGFDTFENAEAYLSSGFYRETIGQLEELAEGKAVIALYDVD